LLLDVVLKLSDCRKKIALADSGAAASIPTKCPLVYLWFRQVVSFLLTFWHARGHWRRNTRMAKTTYQLRLAHLAIRALVSLKDKHGFDTVGKQLCILLA